MGSEPFIRGAEYLKAVRQLVLEPTMIDVTDDINERIRICTWIGEHIDEINAKLNDYLNACHQCFYPEQRRSMRILAAPLASSFGIDALCNILLDPITLVIDVGQVGPADWLSIVVHEYAHAHLKAPGHDQQFLTVISHLCLGLGLEPPKPEGENDGQGMESWLRKWPYCNATPDPLAFWRG